MLSFKQYLHRLDESQGHKWEIDTPQKFANFLLQLEGKVGAKDMLDLRMRADGKIVNVSGTGTYVTITDDFISDDGFLKFPFADLTCSFSIDFRKELKSTLGFPLRVKSFVQSNVCKPLPTDFENWPKTVDGELILKYFNGDSLIGFSKAFEYVGGILWLPLRTVRKGGLELIQVKGLRSGKLADYQSMLTGVKDHDYPFFVAAQIIDSYMGRPNDIFDCQTALIDVGCEEFAQL